MFSQTLTLLLLLSTPIATIAGAKTTVAVVNNHVNDISYRMEATGLGGCGDKNQPLHPNSTDPDSCFCSWGELIFLVSLLSFDFGLFSCTFAILSFAPSYPFFLASRFFSSLPGTLNNRFIAYDVTHADGLKLCESTAIGGCYAHTEKSNGYTCTVTYEGRNMGQDQAACACVENH